MISTYMAWSPSEGSYIQAYITMDFAGLIADEMCRISDILPNFVMHVYTFVGHFKVTEILDQFKKQIVHRKKQYQEISSPLNIVHIHTFFACQILISPYQRKR